jgi:hypothetical protein
MGIDELDLTIYPYTVGREDCTVLPRSFKTLAEAEAYLAQQTKDAQHREFYLDGPERDGTLPNASGTPCANPETVVAAPASADSGEVQPGRARIPFKSKRSGITLSQDVEELCRSLEEE